MSVFTANGAVPGNLSSSSNKSENKSSKVLNFLSIVSRDTDINKAIKLFDEAYNENRRLALRALFYLRDCRDGKGERKLFIAIIYYVINTYYKIPSTTYGGNKLNQLLKIIPEYGCWSDLIKLHSLDNNINRYIPNLKSYSVKSEDLNFEQQQSQLLKFSSLQDRIADVYTQQLLEDWKLLDLKNSNEDNVDFSEEELKKKLSNTFPNLFNSNNSILTTLTTSTSNSTDEKSNNHVSTSTKTESDKYLDFINTLQTPILKNNSTLLLLKPPPLNLKKDTLFILRKPKNKRTSPTVRKDFDSDEDDEDNDEDEEDETSPNFVPETPDNSPVDPKFVKLKTKKGNPQSFMPVLDLKNSSKTNIEHKEEKKLDILPIRKISLAGKWIAERGLFKSGLYKQITKRLIKKEMVHNLPDMRKRFLGPIKKELNVVERVMSENKWSSINYSSIPSRALKKYLKAYNRHDGTRFNDYVMENKLGTKKLSNKQLHPCDIVNAAWICSDDETAIFLDTQWKNYVESLSDDLKNKLKMDTAICDVSGSMGWGGNPLYIDVAIAVGLLIAEISKQPLISFSQTPALIPFTIRDIVDKNKCSSLQAESIVQKVRYLRNFDDMGNTNLELTFTLLSNCISSGIMRQIERIWILTDGQLDNMCSVGDDSKKSRMVTAVEKLKDIFNKQKLSPPKIMFWNIAGMTSEYIAMDDQSSISLISGFSPILMKSVLNNISTTPYELMKDILENTKYALVDTIL
jgi:hypothetical protein